jgi:hypothetical protein
LVETLAVVVGEARFESGSALAAAGGSGDYAEVVGDLGVAEA